VTNLRNAKKLKKSKKSKSQKSQKSTIEKEHFDVLVQKVEKSHIRAAAKKIQWHPGKDFRSGGFSTFRPRAFLGTFWDRFDDEKYRKVPAIFSQSGVVLYGRGFFFIFEIFHFL
jgi:hypothetical protein